MRWEEALAPFLSQRRGLGLISPADVPARLRPWVVNDTPIAPRPDPGNAQSLQQQGQTAERFFKSFNGRSLATANHPQFDARPPWIEMPAGAQTIFQPGIISTPAAAGTDQIIQTYVMPAGWDGVLTNIANFYTGLGFAAGSGNLIWRILRNGQPIKNFDSIQVALGTYTNNGGVQPFSLPAPIRVFSGEIIKYIVNHAVASVLPVDGTQIITFLGGYQYPRPQ